MTPLRGMKQELPIEIAMPFYDPPGVADPAQGLTTVRKKCVRADVQQIIFMRENLRRSAADRGGPASAANLVDNPVAAGSLK